MKFFLINEVYAKNPMTNSPRGSNSTDIFCLYYQQYIFPMDSLSRRYIRFYLFGDYIDTSEETMRCVPISNGLQRSRHYLSILSRHRPARYFQLENMPSGNIPSSGNSYQPWLETRDVRFGTKKEERGEEARWRWRAEMGDDYQEGDEASWEKY